MKTTRVRPVAATIAVEGLTKRYRDVTAVDDLSFSVRAGAVMGFLGPNGAGKTTALKAIVGLARPTAGRALINGAPIDSMAPDARLLGVCIESCGAHPGRSARDHLRSLAALAGSRAGASKRCSRPSGSSTPRIVGLGAIRPGCASGSGWRRRCSAIRRSWCWTSR
jgi:ABC-type uncharacterized transport system ATPase subunit